MSNENNGKFEIDRRTFLKGSAGAIGGLTIASNLTRGEASEELPPGLGQDFGDYEAEDVIYTLCEQCNTHCTIKAVITEGEADAPYSCLVRKIAGNPYSPITMEPHGQIPYDSSPEEAAQGEGELNGAGRSNRGGRSCLKGQSGIQTAFDEFRVKKPLKRVGPRGSGEWESISWEQLITDVVNGSADLGTPGLKDIWSYVSRDEVMADWDKVKDGELTQEEFDEKYKDQLIDTRHPDFGPKANQIVNMTGDRRNFFIGRFWSQTVGTVNSVHHGGICGITGVMGNIRSFNVRKRRMYADAENADFMIVWGTDPMMANKGPTWLGPKYTNALKRGMKMAVVDPRLSPAAEKADHWIPVKPGSDGALALGIARWMIENERYDKDYLINPNQEAAEANEEPTWSDATYLIDIDDENMPKLRAGDLGIGDDEFVVIEKGRPVAHSEAGSGELEVDTTINGIRVKSAFTLFKERVMEKSIEEYAQICEIDSAQIIELAREFTSYGKKASIISYRGPAMHGNGFHNLRAINCLNHLIGNYDWKGGSMTTGASYNAFDGVHSVMNVPDGYQPWGLRLDRANMKYEASSLFERDGYPAQRQWFPLSNHGTHEVLPSAGEGYPYPIKALFIHRISPILSVSGGNHHEEILKDPDKISLVVCSDLAISETSMYADYIIPDRSYLERWGIESIYPNHELKLTHFQQPVTNVFPETKQTEDVVIDIAKKMGWPGVGEEAFADGSSLDQALDFYLKVVANIAHDEQPVPDAEQKELEMFRRSREKALGAEFDLETWKSAVRPAEWAKVVYVLNRGGRFEAAGDEYDGPYLKYKYNDQVLFYNEAVAATKHSYSGENFDGLPKVEEIKFFNGQTVDDSYPLSLINWKAIHLSCHRMISNTWTREIKSENLVWINPVDARERGLKNRDEVKIKSVSFEVEGRVLVTEGIKPGVVGSNYNYGHRAYGSRSMIIDGQETGKVEDYNEITGQNTGYASGRGTGFNYNDLQRLDDYLNKTCLADPIGGGASQLDTKVEIIKKLD